MRTTREIIARTALYDNLDVAIGNYAEMIADESEKHKANKAVAETLESLIRAWALLHETTDVCDMAEKIKEKITVKSPELPFEFPPQKKVKPL